MCVTCRIIWYLFYSTGRGSKKTAWSISWCKPADKANYLLLQLQWRYKLSKHHYSHIVSARDMYYRKYIAVSNLCSPLICTSLCVTNKSITVRILVSFDHLWIFPLNNDVNYNRLYYAFLPSTITFRHLYLSTI